MLLLALLPTTLYTFTRVPNVVGQKFIKRASQRHSDQIKGTDCTLRNEVGLLIKMADKSTLTGAYTLVLGIKSGT